MKNSTSTIKNTVILVVIALILSAILGVTNELTKDKIVEQNNRIKAEAYQAVFSDAASFEEDETLTAAVENAGAIVEAIGNATTIEEALTAKDDAGNPVGIVVNVTNPEGYGGDVNLSIGVSEDGTMTGMKVVKNSETAGLGARCTEASFADQFAGIQASEIAFSKTGKSAPNEVDAISSATYTTRSVTNGVNAALAFAYQYLGLGEQEGGSDEE